MGIINRGGITIDDRRLFPSKIDNKKKPNCPLCRNSFCQKKKYSDEFYCPICKNTIPSHLIRNI